MSQSPAPPPEESAPPEQEPRRIPSTIGGLVYLILVAVGVVGLLVVTFGSWRRGVAIIGAGLVIAAGARGLIPDRDAGMLGVRGRWFDIGTLGLVGTALIVLAASIPEQPA